MARQRIFEDHTLSGAEKKRRFDDNFASIDSALDEALKNIDFDRRNKAESSFYNWCCTYGCPSLLQKLPPPNAKIILDKMESSLNMSKPLQLQLHRGAGKSCFAQLFLLFQICTMKRRFPIIVSANARAGNQLLTDIFRFVTEDGTPFSVDYPSISIPFQIANGSYRRRQIYKGKPTNISKTSSDLSFADIDIEGQPKACHICARGITSGLRGLRKGALRVDSILLDDIIGDDDTTEEATNKVMDIIQKSILNLGGVDKKIACCLTSTPIGPEDVTQRIKKDPNWVTVCYPAIIQFGDIETELWKQYWDLYDTESIEDKPHTKSDGFYIEHQSELEDGFVLYNPDCYTKGENVSGVQSLMHKRHLIGVDAFDCEFLLSPKEFSSELKITPQDVLSKINPNIHKLVKPEGTEFTVASFDINPSKYLTGIIACFNRYGGMQIIYQEKYKCHVSSELPEQEYDTKIYELLAKHSKHITSLGVDLDALVYDGGGTNFRAVGKFAQHSRQICGVPCCAFLGRASHLWNPNVRSKIRSALGRTILCSDDKLRWVAFDSDYYRQQTQKSFLLSMGADAGIELYDSTTAEMTKYAQEICDEKLLYIQHKDNKDIYVWKSLHGSQLHDYLDATAQAKAAAVQQNIGTQMQIDGQQTKVSRKQLLNGLRRRLRII